MKSFNTEHEHPAAESGDVFAESNPTKNVDDDGREKRTGTWLTASAHIITAVIGSGVLSLSWAIAQLGWIAGLLILVIFSFITYFTSTMLADCYRAPDPVTGKRNYTYMDVVRSYLGGRKVQLCGVAQYGNLIGITVGYTITASISLVPCPSSCIEVSGVGGKSKMGAVVSVTGCDEETWDVESVSVITVGDTLSGEPSVGDSGLISAAVSVVEDGSGEDSVG
ncbi:hypothetical protein F2Q69_00013102 [Brassica cretica]|uniref:Amino acid transporter transmembrane domain-containing protein n=1 Tax=Brassica cretica TaxID=69181 RepID=A0A8S9QZ82_BRACR|nr:hypothetical protein F2Q69_00013102 [Brassica cretica]